MTTMIDLTDIAIENLDQIDNMADLKEWTKGCNACELRSQTSQVVHSSGPFTSPVMGVGMSPATCESGTGSPFTGRQELQDSRCVTCQHYKDCYNWQTGQGARGPLVSLCRGHKPIPPGQLPYTVPMKTKAGIYDVGGVISAGQLLDDLLVALGIDRKKIFFTNIALCKPTSGDPKAQYINCCSRIRLRTEELLDPKVIITFGNLANSQYTGKKTTMKYAHGVPQSIRNDRILVPTYHPASILRTMLATSNMNSVELTQAMEEVKAQKFAMYDDVTTAFNLLDTVQLQGLLLPGKELVDGKLPIRK